MNLFLLERVIEKGNDLEVYPIHHTDRNGDRARAFARALLASVLKEWRDKYTIEMQKNLIRASFIKLEKASRFGIDGLQHGSSALGYTEQIPGERELCFLKFSLVGPNAKYLNFKLQEVSKEVQAADSNLEQLGMMAVTFSLVELDGSQSDWRAYFPLTLVDLTDPIV